MNKFKPMLAIDATDHLETIKYPKMASYKLDGIRVLFHPILGIVSRSLKPIPNKQLKEKFQFMLDEAKRLNRIFDGEFYSHKLTFQEITRTVMTKDFTDPGTIKKLSKTIKQNEEDTFHYCQDLLDKIKFYCFETRHEIPEPFESKQIIICSIYNVSYIPTIQTMVNSTQEVKQLFSVALNAGYEGLILRDPWSPYKFGRSTLKEEYMLKVKPFETFDAEIVAVEQATEVDPNAEKKINELGRSVTSRLKEDRILIEKASAFLVKYNRIDCKVSLAMTDTEKEEVWKNRESYIGQMIEYKGMMIGAKDVPRHPVFVRFREDRD